MTRPFGLLALLGSLLVVMLAGCSADTAATSADDAATSPEPTVEASSDDAAATGSDDVAVSPEPTAEAPSAEPVDPAMLVGEWFDGAGALWDFDADGTYTVERGNYETGAWSIQDDVLTVVTAAGSTYCAGTTGEHRLVFDDDGISASVTPIEDDCTERRRAMAGGLDLRTGS